VICVAAVTGLALRDCRERQLTLNLRISRWGGIDAGKSAHIKLHRISLRPQPARPLNADEEKNHFENCWNWAI